MKPLAPHTSIPSGLGPMRPHGLFNGVGRTWPLWALALVLGACAQPTPTPSPTPLPTATAIIWPTAIPPTNTPTATPIPLAARVNEQPVTLELYQKEVERCQLGQAAAQVAAQAAVVDCGSRVLQTLITNALIEQAATQAGLSVADDTLTAELAQVEQSLGGATALNGWLSANHYTQAEFRTAVALDLLRAQQLAQVAATVGPTAEQVHAQMILVADEGTAQALLTQLQNGGNFGELAASYSRDLSTRAAGGDLGWFPRAVLTVPEVEAAAFALADGALSELIVTPQGYYIVQTLEHDPARPLSPTAAQTLRTAAVQKWLADLQSAATIKLLVQP